ncbi:major outer sheath protein Msp [Treponema denticola]|jgi:major outer sheath protein|uniref:major outer sheath protein Msp n=1 Tax=Treponema denticola TaxID=158 RepID=UPI0020A48C06|nr:MSP porin [Treponema denticola]UTC86130.1 MSP porin [Treponema denticola]
MKKILAILMILVLVGGVAFAQLTPQVTAKASVNWGIDFGAGKNAKAQHGFENLLDAKVVIPLYMGTLNSKTEGDVRMNFDLGVNLAYRFYDQLSNSASPHLAWDSDAEFKLWRKTLSDMSASIHFFGGYMNVYGRPDFSTNYAQIWSPIRDNGVAWGPETSGDITGFGTKLGYASDDLAGTGLKFDAGLKFGSNGSWKAKGTTSEKKEIVTLAAGDTVDAAAKYYKFDPSLFTLSADGNLVINLKGKTPFTFAGATVAAGEAGQYVKVTTTATGSAANKYAFGLDLSLGYDKWVTLDFGINATFDNVKDFGKAGVHEDVAAGSNPDKPYLGMGFKLGSKPVDGLALTLAMDALMNVGTDSKVAFDLRFDASYKWVALGAYFGNDLSAYAGKDKNNKAIGDMAAMIAFKSAASGDTNFVEGLAFGVDFRLNHLLSAVPTGDKSTLPMGISAWVNYKYALTDSMWVKPYANFWGETNRKSIDASKTDKFFGVAYKVGATFSPAEKIEIDTYWSQGKLSWNKYEGTEGMISAPAFDAHNGTFVIGVKVIY